MPVTAIPKTIRDNYEIHEWRHASAILERDFSAEWSDVCDVLSRFRLCVSLFHRERREKSHAEPQRVRKTTILTHKN